MSETTFDFGWGQVPVHRHENGNGWVADTAMVEDSCYIGIDALVYGDARVCGNARVYGDALVCGDARVYGNARVCGGARVCGDADLFVVQGIAEWGTATFFRTKDEPRVVIGCRYFTENEAIARWDHREDRKATLRLIRFVFEEFRKQCK